MTVRIPAKEQPENFKFTLENLKKIQELVAKYPKGKQKSAVIPVLYVAQNQAAGWLPIAAMNAVAEQLDMPYIRVYEVASFYTMFNLVPVGKNHIQICRTTPCWLRGADKLTESCRKKLNIEKGKTSEDANFTLSEVECLGACVNAPVVQINDDYYEDLTPEMLNKILDDLAAGKKPKVGTQIKRQKSAPEGGLTSLQKFVGGKG